MKREDGEGIKATYSKYDEDLKHIQNMRNLKLIFTNILDLKLLESAIIKVLQ